MSGYSEGSEGLIDTEDDTVALIQKPFSAEKLLRRLREVLPSTGGRAVSG